MEIKKQETKHYPVFMNASTGPCGDFFGIVVTEKGTEVLVVVSKVLYMVDISRYDWINLLYPNPKRGKLIGHLNESQISHLVIHGKTEVPKGDFCR